MAAQRGRSRACLPGAPPAGCSPACRGRAPAAPACPAAVRMVCGGVRRQLASAEVGRLGREANGSKQSYCRDVPRHPSPFAQAGRKCHVACSLPKRQQRASIHKITKTSARVCQGPCSPAPAAGGAPPPRAWSASSCTTRTERQSRLGWRAARQSRRSSPCTACREGRGRERAAWSRVFLRFQGSAGGGNNAKAAVRTMRERKAWASSLGEGGLRPVQAPACPSLLTTMHHKAHAVCTDPRCNPRLLLREREP